jgi:hypothetical protein
MGLEVPKLPFALRALNTAGAAATRLGLRVTDIGMDALLTAASSETSLDDFGDPFFRAPLSILLESLESEASLTTLGRMSVREEFVRGLKNRLYMTDVSKQNPEITTAPITKPLFILGLPRSGTSILHELLAQDYDNRVPMTWEVHNVWPPAERASFSRDPRIEQTQQYLNRIDQIIPGFAQMHAMGARLPQECVAMMAHDFASLQFHTTFRIPTYQRWFEALDMGPVYASHRRQLQYMQWKCPRDHWVLKSPGHLWTLDALLDEYPDALIVQTHRDPVKVLASLVSLVTTLRGMASSRVDPTEIGEDWAKRLSKGLHAASRVREERRLPPSRIFDMHFHELLRDEIGMVRRIYEHFDRDLSAEAEDRMRAFLAEHSREDRGRHAYRFADSGLDADEERHRFARYQQTFDVPSERLS